MAMTLRLADDETALLRQAQLEGRSLQEVVRLAIREHRQMELGRPPSAWRVGGAVRARCRAGLPTRPAHHRQPGDPSGVRAAAGRPADVHGGEQRPALRNGDLALTSTLLVGGGATVEVARRQPDGTWLWVIDQPTSWDRDA
jgi:hypothetical protein